MKRLIAAALIAAPMANANALCIPFIGCILDPPSAPSPTPPPAAPPSSTPVAAPEIDAAAGTLAIALAGGGMALLARSRRRRDEEVSKT